MVRNLNLSVCDEEFDVDKENPNGDLNRMAKACLHGNAGTDIWFDKSFDIIVFKNGEWRFNAEHALVDAPVLEMTLEKALVADYTASYEAIGSCLGKRVDPPMKPQRLVIQMTKPAMADIKISVGAAIELSNSL